MGEWGQGLLLLGGSPNETVGTWPAPTCLLQCSEASRRVLACAPLTRPRHAHAPRPPRLLSLQEAEKQLEAAIAYKASFLDGHLGKSALAQLRAKLAADYLIVPVK